MVPSFFAARYDRNGRRVACQKLTQIIVENFYLLRQFRLKFFIARVPNTFDYCLSILITMFIFISIIIFMFIYINVYIYFYIY